VVSVALRGSNLKAHDDIEINNNAIQVCWKPEDGTCSGRQVVAEAAADGHTIQLDGLKVSELHGSLSVTVVRGEQHSEPKPLTISVVDNSTPLFWAFVFVLAVAVVIWLMVNGLKRRAIGGRPYGLITAFMLDPETDTYSLSKFQFYIWTVAAVLAYAYVALSRGLVQGKLEFVDVPGTLPGILVISAGTFGIATGVTAAKGPKGAGQIQPSWSDLLTVGGVVVPERVQFVVWTIVAVAAFLAFTLWTDPGSVTAMANVPKNFLYLQGISGAGYLAGKIARSQGPVIWSATGSVKPATGSDKATITIDIIGEGLSVQPGIQIDDKKIVYGQGVAGTVGFLETVSDGNDQLDKSFASHLKLTITDAKKIQELTPQQPQTPPQQPQMPQTKHTISVTNPDGQNAIHVLTIT